MSTFYATTPIYYVNDLPHIGHIYTTVVVDAAARYRRLAGDDVRFLTGTDEHGQKIERAAAGQGVAPIALADRVVERFHELWRELGISHDDFVRTTEARHRRGVEAIIARLEAAGDLYTARHEGWYCTACELFYTEKELDEQTGGAPAGDAPRSCPVHETSVEWSAEENVFFRLSKYAEPLLEWYRREPAPVRPESRLNEVRSFVEGGLKDLSVSRAGLEWGIPFPGRPGQTVYVWLDALTNYVSALGYGAPAEEGELYRRYWSEGDRRVHFVGKDILRFHAVYWPAFLMAAGLPLPTTVEAHGWWLRDDKKVSKSGGNLVRPDELVERFGADPLRYFLLREMVFGQDASFSDEAFVDRYNADLANDLGNTVSRLVTLARRGFDGAVPPAAADGAGVEAAAVQAASDYRRAMDDMAFHRALEALWRLLAETNSHIVKNEPWKGIKDPDRLAATGDVLWRGLEAVRIVATGLLPVMPTVAGEVLAAIGVEAPAGSLDALAWGGLAGGATLPASKPLFPRIDKEKYFAEVAATDAAGATAAATEGRAKEDDMSDRIEIDQFAAVKLRAATVTAAEAIPKSKKLLKLTVDLGDETRTIVAGIAERYAPDELPGKQVVIIANLKPAKLMGVESQGMVLAAETADGGPVLLHPADAVPPGSTVR